MKVAVPQDGWGEARTSDVRALLHDTASHLTRYLRDPFNGTINVVPAPRCDPTPRTHYRSTPEEPFRIQLTARDTYWCQYAFQFSHELCHVLTRHERLKDNPNNWFHETICEIASVFTLRSMAEGWRVRAPFAIWTNYSHALAEYADLRLSRTESQLPDDVPLAVWILANELGLRKNPYLRDKNSTVAYALLPMFEDHPAGWNAIRQLPNTSRALVDYLADWHDAVEFPDKSFVSRLTNALCSR